MKLSLLSNVFFLCVVLANRAFVHCFLRFKVNPKSFSKSKDEPNYESLAKKAFESDDQPLNKKSSKHNYASLVTLAYELEDLSNLKTKSEKNNFAALSKLAFELDDLKNYKKSDDDFGSLVKAAYELDELSDLSKDCGNHNYATIAKLAFQLDDLAPYKKTDGHTYASLAKLAYELDDSLSPESLSKELTPEEQQLKELFENLKFFTTTTTTTFHNAKAGTIHLSFSDQLRPLNDDQYNVEKELNLVDFFFQPSFNCELVSYKNVTVWKKGDADIKVPTTMTFDMDENELVVRDHLRHATYNKMAAGSWKLVSVEVMDAKSLYYDPLYSGFSEAFKVPFSEPLPLDFFANLTLMVKGLNLYTEHGDNIIMANNPEAYDLERIGKFKSLYVFKFHPNTKCVGVEYQGRNIWSRRENDDTPLLEDEYTKDYPLRVVFNARANATYVLFKNTYFVCVRQLKGFYLFRVTMVTLDLTKSNAL
ncbi:hypothetical protein MACK_000486 [Theileria orientalis]|uniref:Uncharacterized protein n=1 Tax=Theileria orientalis TaxID=68886 RepID=A0A976MBM7_THEOR|nr:hypothetical protein MACK_000486 [Theileria orientalis]